MWRGDDFDHGFPAYVWEDAKTQARAIMIEHARREKLIPYSDLAAQLEAVDLDAYDIRLFHLLGEIAIAEDQAGRGMLTAVVVHKQGDQQPGVGFFDLARQLGRNTRDEMRFWATELGQVQAAWKNGQPAKA